MCFDTSNEICESCVVLDRYGEPLYQHDPDGATSCFLPDSRQLWVVLWVNKKNLSGVAHSHPLGSTQPSQTDLTTFSAVERALGFCLDWWIVTKDELLLCRCASLGSMSYHRMVVRQRPRWAVAMLML